MILGIELGSNTIRALLMDGNLSILNSDEIIVASAVNLKDGGTLDDGAKTRILNALLELSLKFDFSAPCVAVATEAFRMAQDSEEFFGDIFLKFGIKFRLIDGISEAKFVKLGILNRLKILGLSGEKALLVDLGGASTELSYGKDYASFKFGILRFYEDYGIAQNIIDLANLKTKSAREFIDKFDFTTAVLTAGVPTSTVALKMGMNYENYDANLVNGQILHYDEFAKTASLISQMDAKEAEFRLGKNRAPLVICGLNLLISLFQNHKNIKFIVVDDGLREGICIAYLDGIFDQI